MHLNEKKAELIGALAQLRQDPACRVLLQLIEVLIDEARTGNDTEELNGVYRNQGEIRGYQKIQRYVQYGDK